MSAETAPGLKRSITFPWLILYGLGTLVGGGFYALLGRVAGEAGFHAPFAILLAAASRSSARSPSASCRRAIR